MNTFNRKRRYCLLIPVLILTVCVLTVGLFHWQRNKVSKLVLEQKGIVLNWGDDRYPARYLGTYDGGVVVVQTAEKRTEIENMYYINAGDVAFRSWNPFEILVVKDGTVYYLETAWKQGWLSQEQLQLIESRFWKAEEERCGYTIAH